MRRLMDESADCYPVSVSFDFDGREGVWKCCNCGARWVERGDRLVRLKPRPTDAELEAAMLAKTWARHRDSGDRGRLVRIAHSKKYGVSVGGLYEPWSELWELEG